MYNHDHTHRAYHDHEISRPTRLKKRLQGIYEMVPKSTRLADIGTDHAYLPAALIEGGKAETVIATDLRSAPLKGARDYLQSRSLLQKVELRQGDGLTVLDPGEVEGIIISGLGGGTMVNMLKAGSKVLATLRFVVLAPHNETYAIRSFFLRTNMALIDETLIEDDGRFYPILLFMPGDALEAYRLQKYSLYEALYLGPFLLSRRGPSMERYVQKEYEHTVRIREQIEQKSASSDQKAQLGVFMRQEKLLKRIIRARNTFFNA